MSALTTVTARAVRPHGVTTPLPESGVVELTPAMHTTTGGAFQSRETVCVTLVDGEISTPITPGIWAVRVRPAHGPAWSGFQVEVPAQSEPFDLATAAPVAVIDGIAYTRGPAGRGIDFLGNADAEGWATVVWTDGTTTQMRVPTVTLTAEERAVLDGVLAQAREAEQDARRAETAAGTAMGHASAAADARDAAQAEHQAVRDALAAGELTGEDGHSPVVDMTGDQVTVDGEIVGPHLTGPAPSVEWQGTRLTVGGQTGPDLKGAPGAPGKDSTVPGPAPATSWQGTALVVDGKVGPDLKGTKGDAGKDSTVPGPPNVLSIGTVTTGAPGSQAAAQIKGTAPSQSLDLTIPAGAPGAKGDPGPPGAVPTAASMLIVGPGRPDQRATTGGLITGSEPVGAEYRSTDGAYVGAWAWQKVGASTWMVTVSDAPPRKIDFVDGTVVSLRNSSSHTTIKRVGTDVALSVANITASGSISAWQKDIPTGFRPSIEVNAPLICGEAEGTMRLLVQEGGRARISGTVAHPLINGLVTWKTSEPWPTVLPGSPA